MVEITEGMHVKFRRPGHKRLLEGTVRQRDTRSITVVAPSGFYTLRPEAVRGIATKEARA